MRRVVPGPVAVTALCAALALAGCGASDGDARSALVDLTVRVDPDGPRGARPARELALRCDQPSQSAACGAAAGVSLANVRPVPRGTTCASVFGGAQTARIVGSIRQDHVDARFDRTNGCEIARWDKVADLLDQVR